MAKILITGVTSGLGFDLAQEYHRKGHSLILVGRKLDRVRDLFINKARKTVTFIELDFDSMTNDCLNSFQLTLDTYGYPECAIHCSGGGLRLSKPNLTHQEMMMLWNANFLGALALNSVLIPKMIASQNGRIIFIGSMAGTHAIGSVGYNTVKAALNAYVRSLGNVLVKDSVLVCGINPGDFLATGNSTMRMRVNNPELYHNTIQHRNPRGRMASSDELVSAISFLAFDASPLFAGSMIAVDGGGSLAY